MKVEKELKKIGIEPVKKIKIEEKNTLIRDFSKILFNTFPNVLCNYEDVAMRLYYCDMQRAIFNKKLSNISYFYKNKTMYFEKEIPITVNNENIIHECIHAIQDVRDEQGKLNKIGLCEFDEFKIKGMVFNEIIVNWITYRMLNKKERIFSINNKEIKAINNVPYYLYQLLKQILYITR